MPATQCVLYYLHSTLGKAKKPLIMFPFSCLLNNTQQWPNTAIHGYGHDRNVDSSKNFQD